MLLDITDIGIIFWGVKILGILKFLSSARTKLLDLFLFVCFFFFFASGFMGISCRTGSLGSLNRLELRWCRCLSLRTKDFASYLFRSFCSFGCPTTKHLLSFVFVREGENTYVHTPSVVCERASEWVFDFGY